MPPLSWTPSCAGAEPLHGRGRCRHPERCVAHAELRDDVGPVADSVKDGCAECGLVERDRFTRSLDPQLRLDTRHRASPPFTTSRSLYREGSTGNFLASCRLRKSVTPT